MRSVLIDVCIFRLGGARRTAIRIVESITPNHVMSSGANRVTDSGVSDSPIVIEELSLYYERA
jgi:hypothetical protein